VQPNRVQQILYAGTLASYVCGDLIGKTLVEKTAAPIQLVLTDTEAALDLRLSLDVPVALVGPPQPAEVPRPGRPALRTHPRFPADAQAVAEILERTNGLIDLGEPFVRIREAITEARKLGVASRN
jgi:hypothetical protein